jgi:hypothetical protein
MNDAQHKAMQDYIRMVADALLLRDWEIELSRQYAREGSWADSRTAANENHARIRLQHPEFWAMTPEVQRETIVHEVMHLHTARMFYVVTRVKDMLKDDAMIEFATKTFEAELEIANHRLARIIAPMMPFPPRVIDMEAQA